MMTDWRPWIGRIGAVAIAGTIFAIDCIAGFDVSISLLYIAALVVVALHGDERDILRTAFVCGSLSLASWFVVHGSTPNAASLLRLSFAWIAIGVTAALLVSRKHLTAARRQLEASRADLQNFTDSVPQILWKTSAKRSIDFFNRRYEELLGHSVEEAIRLQNWTERYHPDDFPRFTEAMNMVRESGGDLHVVVRIRNAADEYRWMSIQGRPVAMQTPDGERLCWYGGTTDVHAEITAQQDLQRLRAELEASRAELVNFMDLVPQILWRATPEGHVDRYNQRYTDVIGRDLNETIARQDWIEDFHPDDRGWFLERQRAAFAAGEELRATYRLRQADGSYRWMSLVGRPILGEDGRVFRYYGGTSDVHDEVTAREELQRTRAELEASRAEVEHFANSVPYILWRSTAEGEVTFFNRRWSEVTGLDREEALIGQRYMNMVHPEDLPRLAESISAAVSTNTVSDVQVRVLQADGSYRWMHLYDRPVVSPVTGNTERFGGASDIQVVVDARREVQELNETLEQRVAERTADLLRTEARYAGLFDVSNMTFAEMDFSATEPILDELRAAGVTDLPTYMIEHPEVFAHTLSLIRTTRVNEALARLMGYESVADLVANPPAQNADDGPAVLLRQLDMYFTGIDHIDGRTVLVGKDGINIPVYFTVNRLAEGLHLSSHLDLTEQERITELREAAQEELARANRIATVGAFSASIAHELNQPIASMVMDAQTGLRFLHREQPDTDAAERILQRLTRTAQRVADIVQHTRDAIVGGQQEPTIVDLCRMAADTRDLLDRELRRAEVSLDILCPDPCAEVLGDAVQLQQVLVNLISNAAEAMRDVQGPRHIAVRIDARPGGVQVSVEDTGPGIADADLSRLFQPFFTTKPTGVGMGLQICRSTIEAMGGTLTAANRSEGGAAFTFNLPSPERGTSAA